MLSLTEAGITSAYFVRSPLRGALSPKPERMIATSPSVTPITRLKDKVSLPVQIEITVVITEEKGIITATADGSTDFMALVRSTQQNVLKNSVVTILPSIVHRLKENLIGSSGTPPIVIRLKAIAAKKEMIASTNICIIR